LPFWELYLLYRVLAGRIFAGIYRRVPVNGIILKHNIIVDMTLFLCFSLCILSRVIDVTVNTLCRR
jgi:hypothetical protein